MGNSLQDQLKRSGLVDAKKAKQVTQERRRARKRGEGNAATEEARAEARRAAAEKAERDRALNRERQREAEARAIAAQVRQLVELNRQPRGAGGVVYNFTDGTVVQRLHVDAAMHAAIATGALAVVRLDDGYEVVPAPIARKIAERDADCVLVLNEGGGSEESDGYEGFEVPDDLMW